MRTRVLLAVGMGAVPVACSFPNITYVTNELTGGDGGLDSSTLDGPSYASDGALEGTDGALESMADDAADDSADDATQSTPDADSGHQGTNDGGTEASMSDASGDGGICGCSASKMLPTNVSCGGLLGLLCSSTSGFTGSPTCGTTGQYVVCSLNGLACAASYTTRTQQCQ